MTKKKYQPLYRPVHSSILYLLFSTKCCECSASNSPMRVVFFTFLMLCPIDHCANGKSDPAQISKPLHYVTIKVIARKDIMLEHPPSTPLSFWVPVSPNPLPPTLLPHYHLLPLLAPATYFVALLIIFKTAG